MSTAPRYVKRCRAAGCGATLQAFNAFCRGCGFVRANVATDDPSESFACACERCGTRLEDVAPPDHCGACAGTDFRWWSPSDQSWFQPDLGPTGVAGQDGIWITGEFTGDFAGAQTGFSSSSSGPVRSFQTPIRRGLIVNPRRIDGPPLKLADDERMPLREAAVGQVRVRYGTGSQSEVAVTLHDVRVHDWEAVAAQELGSSAASLGYRAVGAVRGRAYGFIPEKKQPEPSPPLQPTTQDQPTGDTLQPPSQQAVSALQGVQSAVQSALANTLERSSAAPQDPPTPGGPSAPIDPGTTCWICRPWLAIVLSLGFWLFCGWKVALLGVLLPMLGTCWLAKALVWKVRPQRQWLAAVPVLLSALCVGWMAATYMATDCASPPGWLLWPPLLALATAPLFRPCWIRAALIVLWLAALGLSCAAEHRECGVVLPTETATAAAAKASETQVSRNEPADRLPVSAIGRLQSTWNGLIDRLKKLLYFDSTAQALSQATESLKDNRLLTVDQALMRPNLLSDCKTAVYFPNASMFDLNSAKINRDVESQLIKLEKLREKLPGREIVITGHADKVGADSPPGVLRNIELSEQRAAAVAAWLIDRTGWTLEQIEAVGAGSKFPVIDKDGDVPLNRRVEIRLRCKSGASN